MPTIYLDMDGVCCDFYGAALQAIGHPGEATGKWNFYKGFGLTTDQFWAIIHSKGEAFWADMPEYPWFGDLYDSLCRQGDVLFLTSPSQDPACASGKMKWLQSRFSREFDNFIFARRPHKHLLATPSAWLIDDHTATVKRFVEAGGNGILFPRPWNEANPHGFDPPYELPYTYVERMEAEHDHDSRRSPTPGAGQPAG